MAVLPETVSSSRRTSSSRNALMLFLASFLALYFELVVIRYLSTEIRVFAYLKNLTLVASFFGIGLGMILGKSPKTMKRLFPLFAGLLFVLITFASQLRLTHLAVPGTQYEMFGHDANPAGWGGLWFLLSTFIFFAVVPGILNLVVMFFLVLGGLVGEHLSLFKPLCGYSWNLAGSLAGILAFTAVSFSGAPPAVWILIGLIAAVPFFVRNRTALAYFIVLAGIVVVAPILKLRDHNYTIAGRDLQQRTIWSPYYRITLYEVPPPQGWSRPPAYLVDVNHDYHQKMLDLSAEFMKRNFASADLNREGLEAYSIPYRLAPHPQRVLVVGAGSGNDVAAALRNGATHVDAVEIDPYLVELGRTHHPEHPYDSPRVTVIIDDARAFFKRASDKYDLVVFGFLDSHTMFSSLSVLRLDDYVYTLESFTEARNLLSENGMAVLAFDSGRSSFITDRLFFTLARAFGKAPVAYFTGYDSAGVVFVLANGAAPKLEGYPDISKELQAHEASVVLSSDRWPFLYLQSKTVPVSMIGTIVIFLTFCVGMLRRRIAISDLAGAQNAHLFLLGAGFMLLETKAVTGLSLLFGSTWIVNAVVIAAFLLMGLLANTLMMFHRGSRRISYAVLFVLLALDLILPYSFLGGLPSGLRILAGAARAGLPILFSGIIFSRAFRDVARPAEGLGFNLLGAVVGGVLENAVMIGGTPILGALAIVIYGVSALIVNRRTAAPSLN
jgi:spermidine synthase